MRKALADELTKDSITITKSLDGARNTTLILSGNILNEQDSTFSVVDVTELLGTPKSLRLDNIAFLLEGSLCCLLTYRDEPYFLPLSGKGKIELDKLGGLPGHKIEATFKGVGTFFIVLDISKLGV